MSFPAVGAPSLILPPLWAPGAVDLNMRPAALVPLWERSGHPREHTHRLAPSAVSVPCSWATTEIGPAFVLEDYGGAVWDLPLPIVDFAAAQIGVTVTMWLRLVSHDTGTGDVHFLSIEDGSGYRYRLRTQGTGGAMVFDVDGYTNEPTVTAPTQWAFVAAGMFAQSWGSSGNYVWSLVDGDYSQSSVSGSHPSAKTLTKLIFGNNGGEVDHQFHIADVRIFNRRLTRGELQLIAGGPYAGISPYTIPSPVRADRPTEILTISDVIAPTTTVSAPAVTGAKTLSPPTIVVNPTITAPAVDRNTLAIGSIAPTVTVTAPTVIPGATSVSVPSITITPTITTVGIRRTLDTISPTMTVSSPSISGALTLTVAATISPTVTVSAPTVSVDVSLTLPAISPTVTVSAPTVTAGGVSLTVPTIAITPIVSAPSATWSKTLTVPAIAITPTISAPSVGLANAITVPSIAPEVTVSAPTVTPGAVSLTVPTIAITPTISAPSPTWSVSETVPVIAITPAISAPSATVNKSLTVPAIAPEVTVSAPTVIAGAVTLTVPTIAITPTIATPPANWLSTLTVPVIAVTPTISAPSLTADRIVSVPAIAAVATVAAPAVVRGGVTLTVPVIAPEITVSAPTLSGTFTLTVPAIAVTTTIAAPTVATGAAPSRIWTVRERAFAWNAGTQVPGSRETLKKQPAESITFSFHFADRLASIGGLLTGTPTISASPEGLTISEEALSSGKDAVTLRIAGGSSGTRYAVTVTVDHSGGDSFEVDGALLVLED